MLMMVCCSSDEADIEGVRFGIVAGDPITRKVGMFQPHGCVIVARLHQRQSETQGLIM
jgi:hypothetical protein